MLKALKKMGIASAKMLTVYIPGCFSLAVGLDATIKEITARKNGGPHTKGVIRSGIMMSVLGVGAMALASVQMHKDMEAIPLEDFYGTADESKDFADDDLSYIDPSLLGRMNLHGQATNDITREIVEELAD